MKTIEKQDTVAEACLDDVTNTYQIVENTSTVVTDIRSEHTVKLLQKTKSMEQELANSQKIELQAASCLVKARQQLRRARREFDASLFFVNVFGPMKSGKSTFVNLLAGEDVCPARFGAECTLRPAILINSGRREIVQFRMPMKGLSKGKGPFPEKRLENFNLVIDVIRGIEPKDALKIKGISEECHKLTNNTVNNLLTQRLAPSEEPLITVIHVDSSNFAGKDVAFIDMPGLDGGYSNAKSDPIYTDLISRSDLLLFVQSSIASLNNDSLELLNYIKKENGAEAPVALIHNVWRARDWREVEDVGAEKKNLQKATVQLEDALGRNINSTQVLNLGMIDDTLSKSKVRIKKEMQESCSNESAIFSVFYQSLRQRMKDGRAIILENNCLGNILKLFETLAAKFSETLAKLEDDESEYQKQLKVFNKLQTDHARIDYTQGTLFNQLEETLDSEINKWYDKSSDVVEKEINSTKTQITGEIEGSKLNKKLEMLMNSLPSKCQTITAGVFRTRISTIVTKSVERMESCYYEDLKLAGQELLIKKIKRDQLNELKTVNIEINPFSCEKVSPRNLLGFIPLWVKTYTEDDWKITLSGVNDSFKSQLRDRYEHFKELVIAEVFHYLDKRKEYVVACLVECKKEFEYKHLKDREERELLNSTLGKQLQLINHLTQLSRCAKSELQ